MPNIDAKKIEELLPCPFCGGDAHLMIEDEFSRFRCGQCGATGAPAEYGREYDATAAWNRRASHSVASASVEDGPHEVKLPPGWLARDVAAAAARLKPKEGDADEITSDATAPSQPQGVPRYKTRNPNPTQ